MVWFKDLYHKLVRRWRNMGETLRRARGHFIQQVTPNLEKTLPIFLPILIALIPQGRLSILFKIWNLDVQQQNNNYLFRDKMKIIANTNNMWSWKRNSGHSRSWPLLIIILEKEWIGRYPGQIWKMPGLLSSTSRRDLQLDADTFS